MALDNDLEILPVLNKIDLPSAEPERIKEQIEEIIGLDTEEAVAASAKSGIGIEEILEQIVEKVPAPLGDESAPTKALLVDAWYDNYLGVMLLVRMVDGELKKGQKIKFMSNGQAYTVERAGFMSPSLQITNTLKAGEVGVFTAAIKSVSDVAIGDTVTDAYNPCEKPLDGFKEVQPMVFCGLYPTESAY
jgi:GTP-binding protein LepA